MRGRVRRTDGPMRREGWDERKPGEKVSVRVRTRLCEHDEDGTAEDGRRERERALAPERRGAALAARVRRRGAGCDRRSVRGSGSSGGLGWGAGVRGSRESAARHDVLIGPVLSVKAQAASVQRHVFPMGSKNCDVDRYQQCPEADSVREADRRAAVVGEVVANSDFGQESALAAALRLVTEYNSLVVF